MKTLLAVTILVLASGMLGAPALELSGSLTTEGTAFPNDALFPGQEKHAASFSFQPEIYHQWENGSSITFAPFVRGDSADPERSHFDIREFSYLWLGDSWELRAGVGKVFWGATEFVHLVDIINQTDMVESYDGEDKLGQPMIHFSLPRDWGIVDLLALPYFRERTFPGRKGRLRSPLVVDSGNSRHESGARQRHLDLALRYSHTIGDWDFGIYHFYGTGREPTLLPEANDNGTPILVPFYELINQTGVDAQWIAGEWLLKLEALHRTGQGRDFFASVSGFEYSLIALAGSDMDVDMVGEWAYDTRGAHAATPYQNDFAFGLRLSLNDPAGSTLLAGVMQDLTNSARVMSIEASRRIRASWKVALEARFFSDSPADDPLYSVRDDDFLRLELARHF